jgi:hypothetical protein
MPPGGKGEAKSTPQNPPPVMANAPSVVDAEETPPAGEDTLAAIEDFLSRTQDYRSPKKDEAATIPMASPSATSLAPPRAESAPAPAPVRDAAYANAQISVTDTAPPAVASPPQAIPALEGVSIRASAPARAAETTGESRLTNGPIELQSSIRNDAADRLIATLKEEADRNPTLVSQWQLRTLLAVLEREAEAAALKSGASAEHAALLRAWDDAVASVRDYLRSPARGPEPTLASLDSLRGLLDAGSEPKVRGVALCRKVVTYGAYEEMAADEFVSGRSIQTIVYAEIENLRSREESTGLHETRLATRIEALTADGKSVWHREEPEVVDRCRRPRRDFFVAQRVTLPPALPVGDYVLKFSVEDRISGRIAESSVPFHIRSPVSVAGGQ